MSEKQAEYVVDDLDWNDEDYLTPAEENRIDLTRKRKEAVRLFAKVRTGEMTRKEVGRRVGVTRWTASRWYRKWVEGEFEVDVRIPPGREPGTIRHVTPVRLARDTKAWRGTPTVEGWYAAWRPGEDWTFVRVELMEYWIPSSAPKLAAWHRGVPFEVTRWTHWIGPFKMPDPPDAT